jgi:HAD superfamily hydrolase (TIGR01509 family)
MIEQSKKSMTIKAVAFDMDGLMFNTEDVYWKAASALLAKRGHVYTHELCNAVMGRPPRVCFELFKETFGFPESWQELQTESEDFFLQFLDDGFSTMPGLYELLEHLEQRNIPKGICTSSAFRVVSEVLRRKDLTHRFAFVLTAEDITHGKPDPEIYLKAAVRFGIASPEMLVLEDSTAGCQAAHNAGAFGIAVRAEHNAHCTFAEAEKVVASLNDPRIIDLF